MILSQALDHWHHHQAPTEGSHSREATHCLETLTSQAEHSTTKGPTSYAPQRSQRKLNYRVGFGNVALEFSFCFLYSNSIGSLAKPAQNHSHCCLLKPYVCNLCAARSPCPVAEPSKTYAFVVQCGRGSSDNYPKSRSRTSESLITNGGLVINLWTFLLGHGSSVDSFIETFIHEIKA